MMTVRCMKDVLNKDSLNVNRRFISTKVEHFIEAKSNQIKLTEKDNCQHTSFITKENGLMTYLMEKEDKYMAKIHILMVILYREGNKVGDFITGMRNNVILGSLSII